MVDREAVNMCVPIIHITTCTCICGVFALSGVANLGGCVSLDFSTRPEQLQARVVTTVLVVADSITVYSVTVMGHLLFMHNQLL